MKTVYDFAAENRGQTIELAIIDGFTDGETVGINPRFAWLTRKQLRRHSACKGAALLLPDFNLLDHGEASESMDGIVKALRRRNRKEPFNRVIKFVIDGSKAELHEQLALVGTVYDLLQDWALHEQILPEQAKKFGREMRQKGVYFVPCDYPERHKEERYCIYFFWHEACMCSCQFLPDMRRPDWLDIPQWLREKIGAPPANLKGATA